MATADSLGQKRETVEARLRIAAADMGEDMGGTYLNASILIEKYAEVCKLAVDHPEARMDWWIEKAAEDFSSR